MYASDWEEAENLRAKRYGRDFKLKNIAVYVTNNISDLEAMSNDNPQGVLNALRDQNTKGIGTVYLITLLYFISKGRYPIYDRFAEMALCAIKNGLKPSDKVPYTNLPDKNSRRFDRVVEDRLNPYINDLHTIFGKEAAKCRDVDRALWVYGHRFKQA